MTKTEVEVLASWSGRGNYDMRRRSRVVRREGKVYLVHDGYGGEYTSRGGAYRPFVYEVPDDLAAKVIELVANGDEDDYDENFNGHPSKICTLEHEILGNLLLEELGEQGKLEWTTEL